MVDEQAALEKLAKSEKLLFVGKSIERVDSLDKVLGKPIYTMDVVPENSLYLKVVRSTYAHALLRKIDISRACNFPGVVAVVTAKDIPGVNESTALLPDKTLFASDRVRFVGEPIAAVASYDPSIAEEAVDLAEVDYEPLPGIFSILDALKPDALKIHPGGNIAKHMKLRKGNIEEGFKQADVIVEDTYKSQFQEPVPLETEAGFVIPEPDGSVTCVGSIQSPFHVQTGIAKILALRPEQVRVIQAATGGAFGPKSDEIPVDVLGMAALVAVKTRKPAALAYTRRINDWAYKAPSFRNHIESRSEEERKTHGLGSHATRGYGCLRIPWTASCHPCMLPCNRSLRYPQCQNRCLLRLHKQYDGRIVSRFRRTPSSFRGRIPHGCNRREDWHGSAGSAIIEYS